MNNMLASIDWSNLYLISDINIATNFFYNKLQSIINIIAKKVLINQSKFPKWFSSELRSLIIEKKKVHKAFKSTGDQKL